MLRSNEALGCRDFPRAFKMHAGVVDARIRNDTDNYVGICGSGDQ
jgi:hypothetical protein